ncbi:MAG: hypothetical protein M0Z43_10985, partial [Acidithiobacillus sp.]|nr:hypothetical protein [Acidithiobacillus sp.]
ARMQNLIPDPAKRCRVNACFAMGKRPCPVELYRKHNISLFVRLLYPDIAFFIRQPHSQERSKKT